jgi:hypothetical protein
MNVDEMKVFVDNLLVWEGSVDNAALSFDGPVGMRPDNARLELELRAPQAPARQGRAPGCRTGESE